MTYGKISDPRLQAKVEPELLAGEDLYWVGQPNPVNMALKGAPQFLFGILWMGMLFFIFGQAFGMMRFDFGGMNGFGGIFALFPLIFLGAGLSMLGSPLWYYLKATSTVYAVTNRRALILSGVFSQSVQSFGENDIEFIKRRTRGESGDVLFAREHRTRRSSSSTGISRTRHYTVDIGFFGIPNVREVEAMMLETFRPDDYDDFGKAKRGKAKNDAGW